MTSAIKIVCVILLFGCRDKDSCYGAFARNGTNYEFRPTLTSTNGIEVDPSGYEVDLNLLDVLTDEFEACLGHAIVNSEFKIDRSCINVKVADDSFIAPCSSAVFIFPCGVPNDACADSNRDRCRETTNFNPDMCYCRGIVQDRDIAVVTPDLAAYTHEMIHIIFDVGDPIPENLAVCAAVPACAF